MSEMGEKREVGGSEREKKGGKVYQTPQAGLRVGRQWCSTDHPDQEDVAGSAELEVPTQGHWLRDNIIIINMKSYSRVGSAIIIMELTITMKLHVIFQPNPSLI